MRLRFILILALTTAVGLILVPAASASSVTNPSAELTQGGSQTPVTQVIAGSTGGVTIYFTATTAIGSGNTVTITGPTGTVFGNGLIGSNFNTMTNMTDDPGSASNASVVGITDSGRTIAIEVPNIPDTVEAGDTVRVRVAPLQSLITFGIYAGPNSFQISTSQDTTPASTPPYQTIPAAPAIVYDLSGPQNTAFDQLFDPMQVGVGDQYGNLIPGADVSATVAPSGSSGTFPGGLTVAQVTTGADGKATLPRITANGQIGFWQLALLGPAGTTGFYSMNNRAYADAANVALTLTPTSIPADGSSTALATATVTDEFGNLVPGETLVLSSNNGQSVGSVTDNGDGTYSGQVTATTTAGQSIITATDRPGGDEISGSATLTQTALPASAITLALTPSTISGDGKSTTTAKAVVTDPYGNAVAGASVTFKSDGGQRIGNVKDNGGGTYTTSITANKVAGTSKITATVAGTSPTVTASAVLKQTEVKVIKPVLKFKKPPKKKVKSAKVTFRFKVIKGTAKRFQCRLDKKKWAKCKSPKKVKLKPGKHVFRVRGIATDGTFGKTLKREIRRLR